MPEGPEVRRAADLLHAALAGHPLRHVAARTKGARAWLERHGDALVGRRVTGVRSHGKHLVGHIEGDGDAGGYFFHSHFLMWGKWLLVEPGDEAVAHRDRRERARLVTDEAAALLYSAPRFDVGEGDPYAALPALARLGPDVLPYRGPFDAAAFFERLDAAPAREVGAALLDQHLLAGLGNYLRAEILFVCRVDPWRPVGALEPEERACLAEEIPRIARRAYEERGRTVPDDVQARMREDPALVYRPGQEWGTRHWVFRRTNLPCLRCGGPIRQRRQVTWEQTEEYEEKSRITYFCPTCQGTTVPLKPPKPRRRLEPRDA